MLFLSARCQCQFWRDSAANLLIHHVSLLSDYEAKLIDC